MSEENPNLSDFADICSFCKRVDRYDSGLKVLYREFFAFKGRRAACSTCSDYIRNNKEIWENRPGGWHFVGLKYCKKQE